MYTVIVQFLSIPHWLWVPRHRDKWDWGWILQASDGLSEKSENPSGIWSSQSRGCRAGPSSVACLPMPPDVVGAKLPRLTSQTHSSYCLFFSVSLADVWGKWGERVKKPYIKECPLWSLPKAILALSSVFAVCNWKCSLSSFCKLGSRQTLWHTWEGSSAVRAINELSARASML